MCLSNFIPNVSSMIIDYPLNAFEFRHAHILMGDIPLDHNKKQIIEN